MLQLTRTNQPPHLTDTTHGAPRAAIRSPNPPRQVHPNYPELQRKSGSTVQCIQSFKDDLNLAGPVMDNINRASYEKPTPVQKHALPIGLLPLPPHDPPHPRSPTGRARVPPASRADATELLV